MRTAKLSSLRRWISTRFFTASSFRQALSESEKPRVQAESIKTVHAAKEAVARKWQATPRIIQTSHDQIAAQAYCLNLVRTFDHENFLVNLVLPNRLRRAHAALRALNVELVRIRDHVTNEDLGRIRTAWYRAAVDAIAEGKPPKTPVAEELARVVRDAPGVIRWLHRLVDAREEDLQHPRIVDLGELDQVGEKSQGSLLYAMMELARGPMETEREHLTAELVAKAYGLCIMLRAVPYNAKSRISFVPSTLLKQYEISPREVLKPETTIQTRAVFRDIAQRAKSHLDQARSMREELSTGARQVLVPAAITSRFLARFENRNFNPFDPAVQAPNPLLLQLNLLWSQARRIY